MTAAIPTAPAIDYRRLVRSPLVQLSTFMFIAAQVLLYVQHRETEAARMNSAIRTLSTLVFTLAQHVEGIFDNADQTLKHIREAYLSDPRSIADLFEIRNRTVDRQAFVLDAVIHADGRMYLSSTASRDFSGAGKVVLSDRPHFRVHAEGLEDRIFVSEPIIGRVSRRPVINVTRRINTPTGEFAGVAVTSVSPDTFIEPYRHIVGNTGIVGLYGLDGVARVRIPNVEETAKSLNISRTPNFNKVRTEQAGHFVTVSELDGTKRLYAFHAVRGMPLVVIAGFGLDEIEAEANGGTAGTVLLLIAFPGLGALVVFAVWSQILRQKLEASNQQMSEVATSATRANLAKSRFLGSVSHELRTPLHGISGNAQLIMLDSAETESREAARQVFDNAQHLRSIVNGLLDLAKAEAGEEVLEIVETDLADLAREVTSIHAASARLKSVDFSLRLSPGCPGSIRTDPVALKRVLHNLLDNAVKFTARGQVSLTIAPGDTGLAFQVRDTGVGMSPDIQATLFDPYGRSTNATDSAGPGTGLGLAIASRLVEALGGRLEVASSPGSGSSFSFVLPADIRARKAA